MSKSLEGKTAVVTGATTGIGRATAESFIAAGARVIATGLDEERVRAAQRELPGATVLLSDARSLDAIEALARRVESDLGGLDVLFLNVGAGGFAPIESLTESLFDDLFTLNVKSAFFTLSRLSPLLRPGASVIFNTATVAKRGLVNGSVYSATKGALGAAVRALAAELAPRGVRVNGVSPGPTATPALAKTGLPAEVLDGFRAQLATKIPFGRLATPEETAAVALFLASPGSRFVTGIEIEVDGGYLAAG